ncbi:MAG: glycosyltransferase family 4 protein [Anaerolineales bacterium]|jgi:glycosyltransferase involved in cell wall biosynthesis
MRILNSLYYYRPHYSGLTVYTERLARELASRGHQVTVLTSRYDSSLAKVEDVEGVRVRRVPVMLRVSKGPIMPGLLPLANGLIREHDLLHLHVPQLDAASLALLGRLHGKPVVVTYHCDLSLPPSPLNWVANRLSDLANGISLAAADRVVANTSDYAAESPVLSRVKKKLQIIPPPIEIPPVESERVKALRARWGIDAGDRVIGMVARLASEKGAEVLIRAMPYVLKIFPQARVLYVGQYQDVMGEERYIQRLRPMIDALGDHWTFLGTLAASDLAAFYSLCDVTVLPSLNSTESFGMVQVEAMMCGTPAIASDLPGVRHPTRATGMGLTFAPGDHEALADGILSILQNPHEYASADDGVNAQFGTSAVADRYEELFRSLVASGDKGDA